MPLFQPCTINSPFDGTLYNANMVLAENSFADLGPYVISGLAISAGTGLSVNVALGTASIGSRVTASATTATGLTNSTTNHIYLLNTGAATSNTTGTAPANSVKLGTAVTAGGVVTVVAMGRSAGRQQFVLPQNLIPGGPASGTTSAGHPASVNLAGWAAAAAEGVPVYGTLPAGALPSSFTAPITLTLNDANQNSVQTALTIGHTYNAGGGAAGIGVEQDFLVESSTNGTTKVAANLQATLTDLTPATATGKLSVGIIDTNAQVISLTVASKDIRIPQATAASSQHGLLNLGSGGFDGSAGHFSGDAPGTLLAINAPAGYGGTYLDVQKNAVRLLYLDQFGTLFRLSAPVGTANDGQLSLGPDFAHFDGASAGKFVGSASGTYLAINTETGFAGDLVRYQHHGSDRYRQTDTGDVTMTVRDAATATMTTGVTVAHRSSGVPAASFGTQVQLQLDNDANGLTNAGSLQAMWSAATAANESSIVKLFIRYNGSDVEVARCRPVGTAPAGGIGGQFQASSDFLHAGTLLGFYGVAPVARPAAYTITNPVSRRSYDTTTITLPQLAEVVGTILADMKLIGLLQ